MEVIEIKEQEDGSAIVTLDVTDEDKELLMQVGFETIIRQGMELSSLKQGVKKHIKSMENISAPIEEADKKS